MGSRLFSILTIATLIFSPTVNNSDSKEITVTTKPDQTIIATVKEKCEPTLLETKPTQKGEVCEYKIRPQEIRARIVNNRICSTLNGNTLISRFGISPQKIRLSINGYIISPDDINPGDCIEYRPANMGKNESNENSLFSESKNKFGIGDNDFKQMLTVLFCSITIIGVLGLAIYTIRKRKETIKPTKYHNAKKKIKNSRLKK